MPNVYPTPPHLLDIWNGLLSISKAAGKELGKQIILQERLGKRPISLAGYGLGARVAYYALLQIMAAAESGDVNAFRSLIDSVYLLAAPVPFDAVIWAKLPNIVAGRLVNAYSSKDVLLALFSDSPDQDPDIATSFIGSAPIPSSASNGIENIDLSDLVNHLQTNTFLPAVMERVGFDRQGPNLLPTIPQLDETSAFVASNEPSPTEVAVTTIFDARASLETGGALLDFEDEFLLTPTSGQISREIVREPAAFLLAPLSRPGSNKTLDEDEADREQADPWVCTGI
ncbi:hypothetical protein HDU82_000347 [Entophlyctis luteolus]|nr:hypothetical protein HDU82_000347 [Entophlyctis luteolus]